MISGGNALDAAENEHNEIQSPVPQPSIMGTSNLWGRAFESRLTEKIEALSPALFPFFRPFLSEYCLMTNHYHLEIETSECTLSNGMHRLLGRYVQSSTDVSSRKSAKTSFGNSRRLPQARRPALSGSGASATQ